MTEFKRKFGSLPFVVTVLDNGQASCSGAVPKKITNAVAYINSVTLTESGAAGMMRHELLEYKEA
jgi:hypothetical protein